VWFVLYSEKQNAAGTLSQMATVPFSCMTPKAAQSRKGLHPFLLDKGHTKTHRKEKGQRKDVNPVLSLGVPITVASIAFSLERS